MVILKHLLLNKVKLTSLKVGRLTSWKVCRLESRLEAG
jgi:hypothetical protein